MPTVAPKKTPTVVRSGLGRYWRGRQLVRTLIFPFSSLCLHACLPPFPLLCLSLCPEREAQQLKPLLNNASQRQKPPVLGTASRACAVVSAPSPGRLQDLVCTLLSLLLDLLCQLLGLGRLGGEVAHARLERRERTR